MSLEANISWLASNGFQPGREGSATRDQKARMSHDKALVPFRLLLMEEKINEFKCEL